MTLERSIVFSQEHRTRFLEELQDYLRIPSISTLPEHRKDVERAAAWAARNMQAAGLQNVRLLEIENSSPYVYGEWLGLPAGMTILLYGHYDCQPVDPLALWDRDPFGAAIEDGRIWARGASDNKGQHFAHLKAIESILSSSGSLPVNLKVLLEGEEEIASPHIEPFLTANQATLSADSGIISDGAMIAPGRPSIDYGLRGVAALEVWIHGPARDLHSGSFGGTVLNPAQALAQILAALHHPDGTVAVPGFYEGVREISSEERELLAQTGFTEAGWRDLTGAPAPWGERDFSLRERIGARPTLEINGVWGGFQGEGVKTVIPASAGAKISMRLVPDQDPQGAIGLLKEYILKLAPPQVRVEIFNQGGCHPALMPVDSAEIKAAAAALEETWGVSPVYNRAGGSLPVVTAFQRILGAPFVLVPFGLDDNRHSPNEHLGLDYFHKGIETAIRYYFKLGS